MTSVKESMASGYKMVHDANLYELSETLGCTMAGSAQTMQKVLAMACVTHPGMLIGRQQTILYLRSRASEISGPWNERFVRLAAIEKDVGEFFKVVAKKDSLEDDSIAQLSFQQDFLKPLNHIPWLLFLTSMFKIWMVPAASVCLPLLVWILPYILLRFVYQLPITQDQYMFILQHIMSGNLNVPPLGAAAAAEPLSLKTIFQFLMFTFTFIQSMIQPIQNAMHLYKTDIVFQKIGRQILEVRKAIQEFRLEIGPLNGIHVKLVTSLDILDGSDFRTAFISIHDHPENIRMAFRDLANLECLWRLSTCKTLHPVTFSRGVFKLEDCVDISLKGVSPVASSVELQGKPHAILTGPNGGGKSSFLRAVLQSVLIGHAYGFAPATAAHMPRFTWIASGLQLRDSPGKLSMFETEVKFAAECVRAARRARQQPNAAGLVLFDELFHSTNPPDSARSANQFLQRLWKKENVFSIVSTHIFPLITKAPANVQAICCKAEKEEDGKISYSYHVEPGVCEVSSVHTVWKKFGLVPNVMCQS